MASLLQKWLKTIQTLHPKGIDLGLDRVMQVAQRLALTPHCPVITVAGTNGKGSCVAGLEAIYLQAGYRTGVYTSPILFRHNEYVRVNGKEIDDESFCNAFEKIEKARQNSSLTFFEFNTLAALVIFKQLNLDVWILEVGLGGRLDAVNVIDADAAIIASIDIDHAEWLGDTREKIALEKAGICRPGRPAVCGDFHPPDSLLLFAEKNVVPLFCQNKQFGFEKKESHWNWWSEKKKLENLPTPTLALLNMSTVLMTVELLEEKLPVTHEHIENALKKLTLPGRIQVLPGAVTEIFDVSHNPAAAEFLANWLRENICQGKTYAVFSMLADKDIEATIKKIHLEIHEWFVAPLQVERGASIEKLSKALQKENIKKFTDIESAYAAAKKKAQTGDRIVIFGSFYVVSRLTSVMG